MPTGMMVTINKSLIKRTKAEHALSQKRMAEHLGISFHTYLKIDRNNPVQINIAEKIMERLDCRHIEDVLSDESLAEYFGHDAAHPVSLRGRSPANWLKLQKIGQTTELSNGLCFQSWRLCQRQMADRIARGKHYDLSGISKTYQKHSGDHLFRHTEICDKLKKCPFVANSFESMRDDDNENAWWVIDQWYEGPTLDQAIQQRLLLPEQIPTIMRQIAEGINAIHNAEVICRELSPEKIIYEPADKSVVLTDFELGKLFDGSPTVRGLEWPTNLYRAPEAKGVNLRKSDYHIDLYSWGRILVYAVTGNDKINPGEEAEALDGVDLPDKVRDIVLRCVNRDRKKRPETVTAVLRTISRWK